MPPPLINIKMFPIAISLYLPWAYSLISYVDYIRNRKEYIKNPHLPKAFDQLIQNMFIWLPLSIYILLTNYPTSMAIKTWYTELIMLTFEFAFGEIWFYTLHRLCHHKWFYFLHKKHHEVIHPIGMLANYASPFEVTFVNSGSFYLTHIIFNHSQFHFVAVITIALFNTILYSHTPKIKEQHWIHHRTHKFNFGHSLFMDYLFGTQQKPVKPNK